MTKRLTLHLHLALAKTVQEYLDAHDGDAQKALAAAQRDVAHREGQNSAARGFQRAYTKLVEALKLPVNPDDDAAASDAALAAIKGMSDAGASQTQINKVLTKLGLDPSKLEEQITALKTEAAQGAEGVKLKRELAYRDAADALGYDAGKLTKILRDEQSLPVKRSVTVKNEAGEDSTNEVWGIPSIDATGKETGFTALNQHPDVKGFEASLKKVTDQTQQPAPQVLGQTLFTTPSLPAQRASTAPTNGVKLQGEILVGGAGSI
ncbi:hypothetical protein [Deinococcus ruber]|uniref:Uncharacterized protein n=1 Tax=Deinococcus ruber TaxID=1848197 RepID=A0A918CP67_9DEIO|nr:hypothetical protein [Deinococcus ruber]GGR31408.1 hypothetical protein GCM10008957_47650 [Deinococcus ruber]